MALNGLAHSFDSFRSNQRRCTACVVEGGQYLDSRRRPVLTECVCPNLYIFFISPHLSHNQIIMEKRIDLEKRGRTPDQVIQFYLSVCLWQNKYFVFWLETVVFVLQLTTTAVTMGSQVSLFWLIMVHRLHRPFPSDKWGQTQLFCEDWITLDCGSWRLCTCVGPRESVKRDAQCVDPRGHRIVSSTQYNVFHSQDIESLQNFELKFVFWCLDKVGK